MRILSATIDCYLSITAANYSDFQHHHWQIGPSDTIDTVGNNIPSYTWTVNDIGSDNNGSWSTPMGQSVTVQRDSKGQSGAEARIDTSTNTVILKQLTGFGTHTIHANGNNTDHDVSEMMWWIPPPMPGGTSKNLITWDANAGTPSMIIYQDMGGPIYQLQWGPLTPVSRGNRYKQGCGFQASYCPPPVLLGVGIGKMGRRHFSKQLLVSVPAHGGSGPSIL
jgi:hypothetical protein